MIWGLQTGHYKKKKVEVEEDYTNKHVKFCNKNAHKTSLRE